MTLCNVGPTSKTLGRRCINVIQMSCVCWDSPNQQCWFTTLNQRLTNIDSTFCVCWVIFRNYSVLTIILLVFLNFRIHISYLFERVVSSVILYPVIYFVPSISSFTLTCSTSAWLPPGELANHTLGKGHLSLTMDAAHLQLQDGVYQYAPDPEITSVSPQTSFFR